MHLSGAVELCVGVSQGPPGADLVAHAPHDTRAGASCISWSFGTGFIYGFIPIHMCVLTDRPCDKRQSKARAVYVITVVCTVQSPTVAFTRHVWSGVPLPAITALRQFERERYGFTALQNYTALTGHCCQCLPALYYVHRYGTAVLTQGQGHS